MASLAVAYQHFFLMYFHPFSFINPIALRKAKIVYNFGLSECNRVKETHSSLSSFKTKSVLLIVLCLKVNDECWPANSSIPG